MRSKMPSKTRMNNYAQKLGEMAKGVPKTLTKDQRAFRARQLAKARKKRWKNQKRKADNEKDHL
jgi:hypothetical protein